MEIQAEMLMKEAEKARENADCPYSGYAVGAALLCADGTIVYGCNVENSAYGPSNCAERTAVFAAVAQGKKEFAAIAVAGGKKGEDPQVCYPCGVCRQVLSEFCDKAFPVIVKSMTGAAEVVKLGELLPKSFELTT